MRFDKVDVIGRLWLHRVLDKDTYSHNGSVDEGRLIYAYTQERVYIGDDTDWALLTTAYDVLNAGTKMLMGKYPLPPGWNIATDKNDVMIMITDTGATVGAEDGDTWVITGIDSQGSHSHGGITGNPNNHIGLGGSDVYLYCSGPQHKHSLAVHGVHSHSFSGSWRPAYTKFCEAEYQ